MRRWLQRRRQLGDAYWRIREVEDDARRVIEELERRRDGLPPRHVEASALRRALAEVDQFHLERELRELRAYDGSVIR